MKKYEIHLAPSSREDRYLDPPVEGPSPGEQELIAWLLLGEAAEDAPHLGQVGAAASVQAGV